ncbi:hypothetical protein BKA67DRAFT_379666 [Truncatella angustata]|uniref:Uncharacterized protein n=1 Tax=Truncatella angustata TaxID=152316 RepID=A0A9P8UFI3_9PEZI|nr:uncharacterized protein BKA67DRAFT_379666 [Truncatella angustata]KAH6649022.1 hypothetical protein BKA67DRAFT_379666 [Truncatella angustata]KAH8201772.1 hypothetical protein TruAng_004036 [Truncatella angustata]
MSTAGPTSSSQQPQTDGDSTFKSQLDHKARVARDPNYGKEEPQPTFLEKVADYAPAVGKILGVEKKGDKQTEPETPEVAPGVPPVRPHHDGHIEEFIKDQHRSKKGENGELII